MKKLILLTRHNARLCQMGEPDQVRVNLSHTLRLFERALCPKTFHLDRTGQMV